MTGINYFADTNCFIYLLDEHPCILPFINDQWVYSYITEIELLAKKTITNKEDKLIRQMLSVCVRAGHSQEITDAVIRIRRQCNLKVPDAIIAASAQIMKLPLLTADKEFSKIKELDIYLIEL